MVNEIIVDEDDLFVYCEKWIDGCHIRYTKDKVFAESDLPKNIHEVLVKTIKKMKKNE